MVEIGRKIESVVEPVKEQITKSETLAKYSFASYVKIYPDGGTSDKF